MLKRSFTDKLQLLPNQATEKVAVLNDIEEEYIDYSQMTVVQLKAIARERDIDGYSTMKKAELISVLQ